MITLTPVGTAAAFGGVAEAQSSYLVEAGGRAILFDIGSGALAALQAIRAPETLDLVVVTHMHPDHCSDLFALHVHMQWGSGRGRTLTVLGPPELPERLAAFTGRPEWGPDEGLRFEALPDAGGQRDLGGGAVLRHTQVPHLPPTHALRIDAGGRSFCFGADCAPDDALVDLARGCDLLLLECSFGPDPVPEGLPHLNADSAGGLARRAGASRLLLTHCQGGHDRGRALRRAREVFGGPADWAVPGQRVAA
jgi:ribonuclease BN (tRNA processing enzyme)